MSTDLINSMLDNAVHIGHKRAFWSPKMRDYIYGVQNWIHVFDLYKTVSKLEEVGAILKDLSSKWKEVLIIGTKIQASSLVKEVAIATGNHYIDHTWVPWFLTNFSTIKKRIATYNKLKKDVQTGELEILTKKEQAEKMKLIEKLGTSYEWVKDLRKVPDALVIVDGRFEKLALIEAKKLWIPTYAILWTTGDIDECTNFIPGNVNSIKSIKFLLECLKPNLEKSKVVQKDVTKVERVFSKEESNTAKQLPKKPVTKFEAKPKVKKEEITEELPEIKEETVVEEVVAEVKE